MINSRVLACALVSIYTFTSIACQTVKDSKSTTKKINEETQQRQKEFDDMKKNKPKEYRAMLMFAQMFLGRFGYGVGPFDGSLDNKTRKALREYQKHNQLPVSGDIDSVTFEKLTNDMDTLDKFPVTLPEKKFHESFWDSYVTARGTWVFVNDEMAFPLQTTEIQCYRDWGHCIESTAEIGYAKTLGVTTERHEIERWDKYEIVTKPLESTFGCVRNTLRISRLDKTVTAFTLTISTSWPCTGQLGKKREARLEDGYKVLEKLKENNAEAEKKIMQIKLPE